MSDVRARVLAAVAALAVLAGACGTVSTSAAAVVGDEQVSMEEFSRLVSARIDGLGLEGRELRLAEQGQELGLLAPDRIRQGVSQALSEGDIAQEDLPALPDGVVDQLFDAARQALGDDYEAALEELGLSEDQWREVYALAAERFVAGIIYFGQQQPPSIPLDRDSYLRQVQADTLSELVSAELTRQQFEALDLALDPEEVESQREAIVSSFDSEEQFQSVREQPGRAYPTMPDFDELIVRTQVRQQALQEEEIAQDASEIRGEIEVTVANRFGTWNAEQGRVVAPEV